MKNAQKYILLATVTTLVVAVATFGAFSFAQTVTPLTCSPGTVSVGTNQATVLTASGGNGNYSWSGEDLNITNSAGTQFAVSYPDPGMYAVTVASAGQTATCDVDVTTTTTPSGALSCFPAVQSVTLGETASVSASGGSGTYVWSAPDLTITNPNGSGFSASYANAGTHVLTVTSNGLTSTCAINVLAPATGTPVTTPGLPDTGGGYGQPR